MNESPTIAFFGPPATFTHQAARARFGDQAEMIPAGAVNDEFEAVVEGRATHGVVPVENSTEGAVTMTFDLFHRFHEAGVHIIAEIYLEIHHNLLVRAGVPTAAVKKLYSHPQVFGQCRHWIREQMGDCECVEVSSTSAACRLAVAEDAVGALAGQLAAETYGLEIRVADIEDLEENSTRFLVLGKTPMGVTGDDRTSLMFAVKDKVGALYDALVSFKDHNVNLSMIQSRPSKQKSWEYVFFVDFLGHVSEANCARAIEELRSHCEFVEILGSYPRSRR